MLLSGENSSRCTALIPQTSKLLFDKHHKSGRTSILSSEMGREDKRTRTQPLGICRSMTIMEAGLGIHVIHGLASGGRPKASRGMQEETLLQQDCFSSDLSLQWATPSQVRLQSMQSPFPHSNSLCTLQVELAAKGERTGGSINTLAQTILFHQRLFQCTKIQKMVPRHSVEGDLIQSYVPLE